MPYELAKELKDAGFPQNIDWGHPYYRSDGTWNVWRDDDDKHDYIKDPTLEELIEACGERFALHKNKTHWKAWQINANPREPNAANFEEIGSTPTIATAKLYIALNKPSLK